MKKVIKIRFRRTKEERNACFRTSQSTEIKVIKEIVIFCIFPFFILMFFLIKRMFSSYDFACRSNLSR